MKDERDGAPPPSAYRGEEGAARARVEALERELVDARQQLAALRPHSEPAGPHLVSGLRLLLVGKAIELGLSVLWMLIVRLLPSSHFSLGFGVLELAYLGGAVVALVGLLRLLPGLAALGGTGLIRTAAVGECLGLALGLVGLLLNVLGLSLGSYALGHSLLWRVVALLAGVPLLLFGLQLARGLGRPGLARLSAIALAAFLAQQAFAVVTLLQPGPSLLHHLRGWLGLAASALIVAVAAQALSAARAGGGALGAAPVATALDRLRAGRGLRLHRTGVLVKIVAAVVGTVLLVAAHGTRSPEAARSLTLLMLAGGLLGGGLSFAGLLRFARVPAETGATALALGAALLAGAGLALELASAGVILTALHGSSASLLRTARLLEPAGLALSLPALILLLLALRRVALHLVLPELAARATQLAILVGVVAPIAVVLRIPEAARALGLAVFALGLPALALAIYVLVRYLGLLNRMSEALEG